MQIIRTPYFMTDEEREKWMARQAAKKQALKEMKAQAAAQQNEETEGAGV